MSDTYIRFKRQDINKTTDVLCWFIIKLLFKFGEECKASPPQNVLIGTPQ